MKRLMYLFLLLTLLLVACGGGDEPAAEVEEAPPEVPTEAVAVEEPETAVPTVESAAEDSDSAAEPATVEPATVEPATTDAETTDSDTTSSNTAAEPSVDEESSGAEETSTENSENGETEGEETAETTTAGEGDAACLVGSWRVTNFDDYFAAVVQDAMAGSGQTMEITSTSSGDLLLSFDGTNMTMSDNNFQVIVTVAGQTVPVDIQASGSATYTVEDGVLSGEIDSVNVDDTNTGLGYGVSNIVGQPVSFSCEGDSLSWLDQSGYTVMLSRVN